MTRDEAARAWAERMGLTMYGPSVDADESANFVIVFDDGGRGSAHASEIVTEAARA